MAYTACAMPTCFVNMSDTRSVPEQDAYDYVSYVVSTGKDYDSGQQTKDSLETRRECNLLGNQRSSSSQTGFSRTGIRER